VWQNSFFDEKTALGGIFARFHDVRDEWRAEEKCTMKPTGYRSKFPCYGSYPTATKEECICILLGDQGARRAEEVWDLFWKPNHEPACSAVHRQI
jgi:hypothetical protein